MYFVYWNYATKNLVNDRATKYYTQMKKLTVLPELKCKNRFIDYNKLQHTFTCETELIFTQGMLLSNTIVSRFPIFSTFFYNTCLCCTT